MVKISKEEETSFLEKLIRPFKRAREVHIAAREEETNRYREITKKESEKRMYATYIRHLQTNWFSTIDIYPGSIEEYSRFRFPVQGIDLERPNKGIIVWRYFKEIEVCTRMDCYDYPVDKLKEKGLVAIVNAQMLDFHYDGNKVYGLPVKRASA